MSKVSLLTIKESEVEMRKVEKLNVEYCGYANPETNDELEFECAGLEAAICEIRARIARLRQAQKLNILFEASNDQQKGQ